MNQSMFWAGLLFNALSVSFVAFTVELVSVCTMGVTSCFVSIFSEDGLRNVKRHVPATSAMNVAIVDLNFMIPCVCCFRFNIYHVPPYFCSDKVNIHRIWEIVVIGHG